MNEDLSDMKTSERLRRFADEWRKTFDRVDESVFLTDRASNVIWGNQRFLQRVNVGLDGLSGRKCYELVRHETCASGGCLLKKFLDDGVFHTVEMTGERGEALLVMIFPVVDMNNQVVGAVHLRKDISDHKNMKEFLCLLELISNAMHGINNGLTVVSCNLDVLKDYADVLLCREKLLERLKRAIVQQSWAEVGEIFAQIELFEEKTDYPVIMKDLVSLIQETREAAGQIHKSCKSLKFFVTQNTNLRN
jgi:hypothetical protein